MVGLLRRRRGGRQWRGSRPAGGHRAWRPTTVEGVAKGGPDATREVHQVRISASRRGHRPPTCDSGPRRVDPAPVWVTRGRDTTRRALFVEWCVPGVTVARHWCGVPGQKIMQKFLITKAPYPTHFLRQQGGEGWPSGRRQGRRAERNHFLDSETPRPPVDSSTRQEPEVLSTLESSTAKAWRLRQVPRPGPVTF